MNVSKKIPHTINEYIRMFDGEVKKRLEQIREIVRQEAPDAIEAISYQMPTFKLNGKNLVHFAAWKEHIGFYPTPSGTEEFKDELEKYPHAKGSVQFPLDKPLPIILIRKIVRFRATQQASQE